MINDCWLSHRNSIWRIVINVNTFKFQKHEIVKRFIFITWSYKKNCNLSKMIYLMQITMTFTFINLVFFLLKACVSMRKIRESYLFQCMRECRVDITIWWSLKIQSKNEVNNNIYSWALKKKRKKNPSTSKSKSNKTKAVETKLRNCLFFFFLIYFVCNLWIGGNVILHAFKVICFAMYYPPWKVFASSNLAQQIYSISLKEFRASRTMVTWNR